MHAGEQPDRPAANHGDPDRADVGGQADAASRLAEEAQKAVSYIASLSAGDMIQWTIAGLAEKAWERMGLVANPATGKITRDFEDARLAIDAVAALVDLLAPRIDPAGLRRLQALLADLRINYAAQRSRAESAPQQDTGSPSA
ncbi:MAG: DUF1844 domain-containing protein [Firmicutes bacterium]|nr:DUF1844 domain-containing protein [Bacillota bacterium]